MYDLKDLKNEGKHEFVRIDGPLYAGAKTSSVGVYKLVKTANGKALKKSGAVVRIYGDSGNIAKINQAAEEICRLLDFGKPVKKNIRV